MVVQQEGVVVPVEEGETARSLTVVDVGCRRFQQVLLQRHGKTPKATLGGP